MVSLAPALYLETGHWGWYGYGRSCAARRHPWQLGLPLSLGRDSGVTNFSRDFEGLAFGTQIIGCRFVGFCKNILAPGIELSR